jgi:hypothetical protein
MLTRILSQPQEELKISTPKSIQKSINNSMASKLDEIIHDGGTWDELIEKAEIESRKRDSHIKYTKGVINAHIRYRTVVQNNPTYLSNYVISEIGIFPKSLTTHRESMATKLDKIIYEGGTWEELITKAEIESKIRSGHIKYTKGVLNAHIRYRTITQNNPNYLNNYLITETGIYPKTNNKK